MSNKNKQITREKEAETETKRKREGERDRVLETDTERETEREGKRGNRDRQRGKRERHTHTHTHEGFYPQFFICLRACVFMFCMCPSECLFTCAWQPVYHLYFVTLCFFVRPGDCLLTVCLL